MESLIPLIVKILQNGTVNEIIIIAVIAIGFFLLDRRIQNIINTLNTTNKGVNTLLTNTDFVKQHVESHQQILDNLVKKLDKLNDVIDNIEKIRQRDDMQAHNELVKSIHELEKLLISIKGDLDLLKNIIDKFDI